MNTIYRIYTEEKNLDEVLIECNSMFSGYTVLHGTGYWKGLDEDCLILEFIADNSAHDRAKVHALAQSIRLMNKQEAVLVTETPSVVNLLT